MTDGIASAESQERRLAVVLVADVVGYSRLMAEDEERTLATLATYQNLIGGLVTEHHGRIFKLAGDGLLAEFASAVMGVRCAVAVQRALRRHNDDLSEGRRLLFRIGINLGYVIVWGDDLYGDGVNIAARLQTLCDPGQVIISGAVEEQIRGKLNFPCRSLGECRLKNIAQPVHIHNVDWGLEPPVPVRDLRSGSLPLPDKPSIAVLPLENMSGDLEQEYFADGLTEDLITALAKYRWFFVIARNSSFTYKGRVTTVQQVGRELGVRYVLEGSVRRSGTTVRITAQLVEAETGHHLWAERYDRNSVDVFAVQDEIVGQVVAIIEPGMMRSETLRARHKKPETMTAWDLIFRGMWHFYQIRKEHHLRARELFAQAIAADPSLAEGYIWLVRVIEGVIYHGWSDDVAGDRTQEIQALRRATQLAEDDPYALYALAAYRITTGDPARGLAAAQRAIDLCPSFALGHFALGWSRLCIGRPAEAIEALQRGLRLNPNDPQAFAWTQFLAFGHFLVGDLVEATNRAADALAMRGDHFPAYCALACSLAMLGRVDEAQRAVAEMRRVLPHAADVDVLIGRFTRPADREQINAALCRAGWTVQTATASG